MADEYEVERIVDKRIGEDGTVEYFIKWKDWDESTNTWEPEKHLNKSKKLLTEFNAKWDANNHCKAPSSKSLPAKAARKATKKTSAAILSDAREPEQPVKKSTKLSAESNTKWDAKSEGKDSSRRISLEYTVPKESGFDKGYQAEKIVGATDTGGSIKFLVKWKDKNDVELVTNERARKHCPQLVIKFYEQNIQWDEN